MEKQISPIWIDTVSCQQTYPPLTGEISTDVVIVGGGITGITSAYLLKQNGKKVVVVEQNKIAQGETGHTTGHLTYVLDSRYSELISKFDRQTTRLIYESKLNAIQTLVKWVDQFKIDCELKSVPAYLYTTEDSGIEQLIKEKDACELLGIQAEFTKKVPLPFPVKAALKFNHQYQIHAPKYVRSLCAHIQGNGSSVFEDTHVVQINEKENDLFEVITPYGKILTKHLVMATNSTAHCGVLMDTKVAAYRSYAIATHLDNPPAEEGLFWDTANPYHYIRKKDDFWIIGGEDHKTGHADNTEESIYKLKNYIQNSFGPFSYSHLWSGQIIEPMDGIPFIGLVAGSKRQYLATGYSGNGLTFGTVAGIIISDLISHRENPFSHVYDPHRFKLLASGLTYIEENTDFPICYLKDRIKKADVSSVNQIMKGTGAIVERDGQKVAVFRDDHGELHSFSCVCPHQGCHVHWNQMEKTWDCPCHGSRFDTHGKVINGPSLEDLKPVLFEKRIGKKLG